MRRVAALSSLSLLLLSQPACDNCVIDGQPMPCAAVQTSFDDLRGRLDALESQLAATQGRLTTVEAWGDHTAAGYLTSESDPLFTASPAASLSNQDMADWDESWGWGDHAAAGYLTIPCEDCPAPIIDDLLLSVPDLYPTVDLALASISSRPIAPGATVTITVAPGVHPHPALYIDHPNGERIHLIGLFASSPSEVVLSFEGHGLSVSGGHTLGRLDGLTLRGPGASAGVRGIGLLAERGAAIHGGPDLIFEDFPDQGVLARQTGSIVFDDMPSGTGPIARNNGAAAMEAAEGGYLRAVGSIAASSLHGFVAQLNGTLVVTNAQATNNDQMGIYILDGSSAHAAGVLVDLNGLDGVRAFTGSWIDANTASISGSGQRGAHVRASAASFNDAQITDNVTFEGLRIDRVSSVSFIDGRILRNGVGVVATGLSYALGTPDTFGAISNNDGTAVDANLSSVIDVSLMNIEDNVGQSMDSNSGSIIVADGTFFLGNGGVPEADADEFALTLP